MATRNCPTCKQAIEVEPILVVRVVHDDNAESPRYWDNLGVIATWHRRYNLGDEQPKCEPQEWLKDNAPKGSVVLPVFMIDHSGIALSTGSFGDPWDSGQLGWIVATPDAIRKNFMTKRITKKVREKVELCLKSEIATYSSYVEGDVWGFVVEDEVGNHVDSCWGFIGDDLDNMKDHIGKDLAEKLDEAWSNR